MYLKRKLNHKLECKKDKNRIPFKDCANCPFKEYKSNNRQIKDKKSPPASGQFKRKPDLKRKSNKLAKLERERTSLFTDDLDHCIICGAKKEHLHEVFFGRNRRNSMIYKLILPLCQKCHAEIHKNSLWQDEWHKKGQVMFEKTYPDLKFEDIFKKNYL